MQSLENVLSGEVTEEVVEVEQVETPTETAEAEVEPTVETEEAKAEPEAAPTAEKPDEQTVEQLQKQLHAAIAQANDERSKRQAMQQQQEVEKPDAYVEPDKAIAFEINAVKQDFENKLLNMSELNARARHGDDFDQMTEVFFTEMVTVNPALQQQALQQVDPYEFIYQQAKTHSEFKGINSVDDLRAKLETEIRAKIEAENAEKQKEQVEKVLTDAIPHTLSTATAAAGTGSKQWSGPAPLSKVLGEP